MALDLVGEKWDFKISRIQNSGLKLRIGIHSGPVTGIVTRSPIPRYWWVEETFFCIYDISKLYMLFIFIYTIYSIVGLTSYITRVVGRMGEENRIHISETTKDVLDKLGGFRCEYRAVLDLGVCLDIFRHKILILKR